MACSPSISMRARFFSSFHFHLLSPSNLLNCTPELAWVSFLKIIEGRYGGIAKMIDLWIFMLSFLFIINLFFFGISFESLTIGLLFFYSFSWAGLLKQAIDQNMICALFDIDLQEIILLKTWFLFLIQLCFPVFSIEFLLSLIL